MAMTKSTKKLLSLVGALAVLGGAYGGIVLLNQHNEEKAAEKSKAQEEANTFYLSQIEEPVAISYTNSYGTFSFSYDTENETWSYDDDEHFPVTQSYLTTLSSDMKAFQAERKLEEVQDDLSVYGLDEPSLSITAKGSDDSEVTVLIGSVNSYSSDYYAKVDGADDIYTISSSYVTAMSNDLSTLQAKESFPTITSTSISNVQLVKDGVTLEMEKEVTEEPATTEAETSEDTSDEAESESGASEAETTQAQTSEAATEAETVRDSSEEESEEETVEMVEVTRWVFSQDDKTKRVDEDDDIHDLLVNMVGLTFNDCADYYADETEKANYGLTDGATVLTLTYTSIDEEVTLKLTIGNTTDDDAYYYVSMDDSDEVNTVSKESIDTILDTLSGYEM